MRLAIAAALAAALLAGGAARADEGVLLLWDAPGTRAEADRALRRWRDEAKRFGSVVQPAAGFPRVAGAREYAAIPKGRFAAVLGECAADDAGTRLALLQALDVRAAAIDAPVRAGRCPAVAGERVLASVERVSAGGLTLTAASVEGRWAEGAETVTREFRLVLRDAKGALVDVVRLVADAHGAARRCTGTLEHERTRLVVTQRCDEVLGESPPCGAVAAVVRTHRLSPSPRRITDVELRSEERVACGE